MDDLLTIFQRLSTPRSDSSGTEAFNSLPIPERGQWHLGKSGAGLPAVLVAVHGGHGVDRPLTVGLENLRVEHNIRCRLTRPDGDAAVARYSIIQCLSTDAEVQACFLRTIAGALIGLDRHVKARDLTELVDRLVALFRLVRRPRAQTIRGLWAELFVILAASDPPLVIDAWHSNPAERFDFSRDDERLEVKSSSTRSRDHVFSFEQVYPPSGASVLIASVHVEDQTSGITLGDLWDRVSDAAPSSDARLKIERVCVESLGEDLSVGRASAFDWDLAVESLAFYRAEDIPRPSPDCPSGVSQIQFRSDLSLADSVDPSGLPPASELHRGCLGLA